MFDKFFTTHVAEHNTIEMLVAYGHKGLTEYDKVGYLLGGIKCGKFETVCVNILASDPQTQSFVEYTRLFADYIATFVKADPRALAVV